MWLKIDRLDGRKTIPLFFQFDQCARKPYRLFGD